MFKIIVIIFFFLFLSGCSVQELDNTIKENTNIFSESVSVIQPDEQKSNDGYVINSEEITDASDCSDEGLQVIDGKNCKIKSVGDTFEGYVIYQEKSYKGETEEIIRGTEGVTYTLDAVTVYDNFYVSGAEENSSMLPMNEEIREYLRTDPFIICELSVTYNKPFDGEERVKVFLFSDINATCFEEKLFEGYYERIKGSNRNGAPHLKWFDDPPTGEGEDEGLDPIHNSDAFYIEDGETRKVRIGIVCWQEFIDTNNVYLCINSFPRNYFSDYTRKYFALFPEE